MLVHNGHHAQHARDLSEGRCTRSPTKRAAGLKARPCGHNTLYWRNVCAMETKERATKQTTTHAQATQAQNKKGKADEKMKIECRCRRYRYRREENLYRLFLCFKLCEATTALVGGRRAEAWNLGARRGSGRRILGGRRIVGGRRAIGAGTGAEGVGPQKVWCMIWSSW